MKGKANPLPKNITIMPRSLHLFSTENGRFCKNNIFILKIIGTTLRKINVEHHKHVLMVHDFTDFVIEDMLP